MLSMEKIAPISFQPIGIIHSPFDRLKKIPIQSQSNTARTYEATVEIFPQFKEGLENIEGFSHIYLIYYFHLADSQKLLVTPYLDTLFHGVFATRSPTRPNKIGISLVRLISRKDNLLTICGVDIIDQTPLLDLKPYIPQYDRPQEKEIQIGWLKDKIEKMHDALDDGRFSDINK
jgi:tRNA-Thr(GGU) m(6)t(6)A37 methyltransferase TsaA